MRCFPTAALQLPVLATCLLLLSAGARQPPSKQEAYVPEESGRIAPAGMHLGRSMGWRTIYREPDNRGVLADQVACLTGSFSAAGGQQLLLAYRSADLPPVLVSATGRPQQQHALPVRRALEPAWDFDSDGVHETLYLKEENQLAVLGLDGREHARLEITGGPVLRAMRLDWDGDGKQELLVQTGESPDSTLLRFAPGGKLLSSSPGSLSPLCNVCGDLSGDGVQRRVIEGFGKMPPDLISVSADGGETRYTGWAPKAFISFAMDINKDGRDEIFSSMGYYNPARGNFVKFAQPEMEWDRLQRTKATPVRETSESELVFVHGRALAGDFNHDGQPEVFVSASEGGAAALLYSLQGSCLSYEELGEVYYSAHKLVQDGKDYVALVFKDRVMVSP